jgi:hypothetical protein
MINNLSSIANISGKRVGFDGLMFSSWHDSRHVRRIPSMMLAPFGVANAGIWWKNPPNACWQNFW